jgi:hypothetical protein
MADKCNVLKVCVCMCVCVCECVCVCIYVCVYVSILHKNTITYSSGIPIMYVVVFYSHSLLDIFWNCLRFLSSDTKPIAYDPFQVHK